MDTDLSPVIKLVTSCCFHWFTSGMWHMHMIGTIVVDQLGSHCSLL